MPIRNNLRLNSWRKQANKQTDLPTNFSKHLPTPKYSVGDRCRWIPMPETDWGTVMGSVYAPDHFNSYPKSRSAWVYLLLLDIDSPSRQWTETDWVDEEDLELIDPQIPSSISSSEENI